MSDIGDVELEGDLRMSPEAADLCRDQQEARDQYHGTHDAPPPRFNSPNLNDATNLQRQQFQKPSHHNHPFNFRRKSFSKLRRRLSQTFRFN